MNGVSKEFYSDFISEISCRGLPGTDLPLIVKHMDGIAHAEELLNSDADIKQYTKEMLSTVAPDLGSASAEIVLMMAMMVETILKQDSGRVRSAIAGDKRLAMELTLKFEEIINRLIGNWPMKDKYGLEMNNLQREIAYMHRNGALEVYDPRNGENSYDFFIRVYGKYCESEVLYQDDLFRIDGRLRKNLDRYLRHQFATSLANLLPSESKRVDKVVERLKQSPEGMTYSAMSVLKTRSARSAKK